MTSFGSLMLGLAEGVIFEVVVVGIVEIVGFEVFSLSSVFLMTFVGLFIELIIYFLEQLIYTNLDIKEI